MTGLCVLPASFLLSSAKWKSKFVQKPKASTAGKQSIVCSFFFVQVKTLALCLHVNKTLAVCLHGNMCGVLWCKWLVLRFQSKRLQVRSPAISNFSHGRPMQAEEAVFACLATLTRYLYLLPFKHGRHAWVGSVGEWWFMADGTLLRNACARPWSQRGVSHIS